MRPAGISTINWPLTRTFSWPTPLSKSSKSKPVKVNNTGPPREDLTFTVKLSELVRWPESPPYAAVIKWCPGMVGV